MRAYWLLSLAFVSLPAAAERLDAFSGTPKSVEITGPIDVPLMESLGGSPSAYVWVNFGTDTNYLAELSSNSKFHYMSTDLAEELGLKLKKGNQKLINWKGEDRKGRLGGVIDYVDVDEMKLGELTLHDVRVGTNEPLDKEETEERDLLDSVEPEGFRLVLSLTALEQVGWAILPSEGVVRFVPAADAAALVQGLGTAIPYTSRGTTVERWGKGSGKREFRFLYYPRSIMVDATIGGVSSPKTALILQSWFGSYDPRLELQGATFLELGDERWANTTVSIGGMPPAPATLVVDSGTPVFEGYVEDMETAVVGSEVLSRYDFAMDPVNHTITLRVVATPKRGDPNPSALALAQKRIEKPTEEEADADKSAKDEPEEEWTPKVKDLARLAAIYARTGDLPNALATYKRVTEIKPRKCDGWQRVGETQVLMGDFSGALASFQQASTLHHAWWDIPVEEREDLEKELNKLEEEEREAAENYAQPQGCFRADGQIAATALALSNYEQVAQTYKDRIDLDPGLAVAYGSMELTQGNLAKAQSGYRQAVKMSNGDKDGAGRLGVGITYAETGDWASAKVLFDNWFGDGLNEDVDPIALWLSYVRRFEGPDASLAAIRKVASENPLSAPIAIAWFREAVRAGKTDEAAQAKTKLDAILAWEHSNEPRRAHTWSHTARYLATIGDVPGAAQAADKAVQLQPANDDAWAAKFEVAMLQGNAQEAQTALVRASTVGDVAHPTNALIRRTLAQGQVPDWLVPPVAQ